jgi:hypothetical protein
MKVVRKIAESDVICESILGTWGYDCDSPSGYGFSEIVRA